MKRRLLTVPLFLFLLSFSFGQCPSAGSTLFANTTISSDCTISGDLTIQGPTLTIAAGVTLTVTGSLTVQGDATISSSSTSIIIVGGDLVDNWTGGGTNTISGGTYSVTGDINEVSGGNFTISNATINATDFNTSGGANVVIESGSVVSISGTFSNQENLTIDGATLDIGVDLDATGGDLITVTNNGELLVGGDYNMNSGGGVQLSLTGGGLVKIEGDVESTTGGNAINVDGDSGISVDGDFVGGDPPDVTVGSGDDDTDCLTGGGCCGDASACSSATVLPVSLLDFACSLEDQEISIRWSTASELNNDYFTLERSFNGSDFIEILRVAGAGTTNDISEYNYLESIPLYASNFVFYRLSQTDFDGTYEVLGIDQVVLNFSSNYTIYPNPVSSEQDVHLEGVDQNMEWSIYSVSGKMVKSGNGRRVSLTGLQKGTYLLKPQSVNFESQVLLIK